MYAPQFRDLIIIPSLEAARMHSPAAAALVLGTAIHESGGFCYLKQGWKKLSDGRGVARSFYGIEPDTALDLCARIHGGNALLQRELAAAIWPWHPRPPAPATLYREQVTHLLLHDLRFATIMCRLKYLFVKEPLPEAGDIEGMASYWGRHYQTQNIAADVAAWARRYRENMQ